MCELSLQACEAHAEENIVGDAFDGTFTAAGGNIVSVSPQLNVADFHTFARSSYLAWSSPSLTFAQQIHRDRGSHSSTAQLTVTLSGCMWL